MANQSFGNNITQIQRNISQETIRPSSPTPPHLKTFNLSLLDQFAPDMHTPLIFFYRNFKNGDTNTLKQSLSQTLTQYYPLAGRLPTYPPTYINCNDEGVEFLEAFHDSLLDDFIHKKVQDETVDQLFPHGLSSTPRAACPKLLDVQLNHFACGGAAVALSMSHKLADGLTITNFLTHWSAVTRCQSPINPCFVSSRASNTIKAPTFELKEKEKVNYGRRRFVFPNSKLKELKNKVNAMGTTPTNPSRVELVTSLIFKHASAAAGSPGPSNLSVAVNIRDKFVKKYPETTAGNLFTLVIAKMDDSDEMRLNEVISEVRERKMEVEGIRDEEEVVEKLRNTYLRLEGDIYYSSSACRVPFFEVDFGWGKPVDVTVRIPDVGSKTLLLMDTPSGDGVTAFVHLPEEEMAILEKDKEFVCYLEEDV